MKGFKKNIEGLIIEVASIGIFAAILFAMNILFAMR
jgi:hypothetical protein